MHSVDIWNQNVFPSLFDYSIMGTYLIIIFMWGFYRQTKKVQENPAYKYFLWGLFAKIAGTIALCLIYTLHYGVADTLGFYISSEALVNLLQENPRMYIRILFGDMSREAIFSFTPTTGYPWYRGDVSSFFIVRITSIFTIVGFKNYFTTSILFAAFFFLGYWKLYLLLTDLYPRYAREFAIAVFFFPSVMFWASGIMKDTVSLALTGWLLHASYYALVKRVHFIRNGTVIIITTYLILSIKPYILVALIPGVFIWLGWTYIKRITNPVVRFMITPAAATLFLMGSFAILNLFSNALGDYGSLEGIVQKAIITYDDHTRAVQYGENYYTLGEFDGTFINFISKAPTAITAGLFRPYIWEVRNIFMLLAAIENTLLFFLIFTIFWKTGIIKTFQTGLDEPLVIFSISFAIVFAFAVGVSTANFGALVRLKTPMLPLLAAGLITLYKRTMENKHKSSQVK